MEEELKLSKEDVKEVSFERVHRLEKPSSTDPKPRPLIAKFALNKRQRICVNSSKESPWNFACSCLRFRSQRPVVERKLLIPILKYAKKKGYDASLLYDKLQINEQLYRPYNSASNCKNSRLQSQYCKNKNFSLFSLVPVWVRLAKLFLVRSTNQIIFTLRLSRQGLFC